MALSPTLQEMQLLSDKFHMLGDDVLRHFYADLQSLKPFGYNAEGKPVKGVPDSYVGISPLECSIGVEYTTTGHAKLEAKFEKDLNDVVERCSKVKKIILCTNRPEVKELEKGLRTKAKINGKELLVIWGEEIARILDDERQDLRRQYLDIPLRALTKHSIIPELSDRVHRSIKVYLSEGAREAVEGSHLPRRRLEAQFNRLHPNRCTGVTLVSGDAGLGKSTWSAYTALRLSCFEAVAWLPAKIISRDDINTAVVNAVYGTKDPSRIDELSTLLRSTNRKLILFLDAIDEHPDYQHLLEELQNFDALSPLSQRTHLVLTCRTEALRSFESIEPNLLPASRHQENSRRIILDRLTEDESEQLLRRQGATFENISNIKQILPLNLYGNPFFLKLIFQISGMDVTLGSSTELIKGFAEFFVKDISKRLPSNRQLSILDIYKAIGIVANQAISGAQGADLGTLREHSLLRLGMSDERTLLQRAIQCGLLVYNDSRILFCHALLCEFFVAYQITTDTTLSNEQKVHEISGLPGRASVAQFASMLDSELILQFVKLQPSLVDKFKPEMLDVHVTQELHAQAKSLLNSKYPSDRQTGVRIFRTLQTSEAKQIAVDWYNNLNQNERSLFYQDAIDLFMVLEIPEAVGIVAQHHGFFASSDIALYDPDFVHSLEHLSDIFRNTLADYAFEGLLKAENGTQAEARFTTILSHLRDPRLVVQLEGKAQVDLLQLYEHRALIHINTEQAMKIYLKSRDYYYKDLDEIDPEKEGNDYKRSSLWYRLVPKQSDISLFPHDAILELTKQALRSKNWNDVSFGIEFASTLQNPDLMDTYADAIAQRRRKTLIVRAEMIRNIVVLSDVDTILELFDKVISREAKKLILRAAGDVRSERIEELLINSLDDKDLFDSACIGLTELRSIRSAPKIHTYLPKLIQPSLYYAITALGRLQYEPALDILIPMLEKIPLKYTDDDRNMNNNEYNLINAIGEIGGQTAWSALAKRSKGQMLGRIFTYLIDSQEEHAFGIVHGILESDARAKYLLTDALVFREGLHGNSMRVNTRLANQLKDDVILDALLEVAREHLDIYLHSGEGDLPLWSDSHAIIQFDSLRAIEFIEEIANQEYSAKNEQLKSTILFAREFLQKSGNEKWTKFLVERKLDVLIGFEFVELSCVSKFCEYPRDVVRGVLLERISQGTKKIGVYIYLLTHYCEDADIGLIRSNLCQIHPDIVDVITQRLPVLRSHSNQTLVSR